MQESSKAEREQVATACRLLAAAGLVHRTGGNAACAPASASRSRTGAELATLAPADVTMIDLAGHVIDGDLAPTSELDLHLAVYERYGAGAVVHTHAPVSTALSCVLDELPCVHYEMLMLGGPVRVAPYKTFATLALAAAAVEALEDRTAALLANHGTIAFGTDLDAAVRATELLEWAATVYWRAAQIGTPRVLDEHERQAVIDVAIARSYGTTQSADEHRA